MKVAYLVNQYPHVSHSFIRREILALEGHGITVERFSVRQSKADLVDPADQTEQTKTNVILAAGAVGLALALLRSALTRPGRFCTALAAAVRLGRRSERGVLRHFIYLAEACVLLDRLRTCRAQHVHAHFGTNSATVVLLTRLLGGPTYSFTVHGPEEFDRPENLSLREKIEHAAFVVAISAFGRSQLFRWCSYPHWEKIQVVRCGVDAAFLAGGAQAVPNNTQLVCVGRLAEQKGQLLLLDAAALLLQKQIPFQLVLAGNGEMRSIIEDRIKDLRLGGKVRITGWLSNAAVKQEMLGSRLFVLPSFAEGLPVVLMEALALGRPVITTYVAGIPELVDAEVGWLVPAGSVDRLANALEQALATPIDRLNAMGKTGAARVAEQHDIQREAGKLAELFKRAAGSNE